MTGRDKRELAERERERGVMADGKMAHDSSHTHTHTNIAEITL